MIKLNQWKNFRSESFWLLFIVALFSLVILIIITYVIVFLVSGHYLGETTAYNGSSLTASSSPDKEKMELVKLRLKERETLSHQFIDQIN